MAAEVIVGVIIPINSMSATADLAPIDPPEHSQLRIVRYTSDQQRWAVLWTLATEDECAPEVRSSLYWLYDHATRIGREYILGHGYLGGDPQFAVFEVIDDDWDSVDLGDLASHDFRDKELEIP